MYELTIRFHDGRVTVTEEEDLEQARSTGKYWLLGGHAIGFSIEPLKVLANGDRYVKSSVEVEG